MGETLKLYVKQVWGDGQSAFVLQLMLPSGDPVAEAEAEACEEADDADVMAVVATVVDAGLVVASVVDDTAVVPSVVEDTAVVASVVDETALVVEDALSVVDETTVAALARQPFTPCP